MTTYAFTVRATDAIGGTATRDLSLVVAPTPVLPYWRIYFDANDGSGLYDGIEELELRGEPGGPDLTGSGTALASSEINSSNTAAMAFDNSTSARWLAASAGAGQWLQYYFGTPVAIGEISIIGPSSVITASPKDFRLQGSSTGSSWTDYLTVTGETGWTNFVPRVFTI